MTISEVEKSRNLIDWIVRSDRIFVILTIILFFVLLYILLKEREDSKKERKGFVVTLNNQQNLIDKQQDLLEKMYGDIKQINTKLDVAIFRKEARKE